MSAPVAVRTSRTRAEPTRSGPSSGKPATAAPSERLRSGPRVNAGAGRPGTESTARSRRGSKRTTRASYERPVPRIRTRSDDTPATTWALVTTRSGATTQPLPSCPRLHDSATPVILTIDPAAPARPESDGDRLAEGG